RRDNPSRDRQGVGVRDLDGRQCRHERFSTRHTASCHSTSGIVNVWSSSCSVASETTIPNCGPGLISVASSLTTPDRIPSSMGWSVYVLLLILMLADVGMRGV